MTITSFCFSKLSYLFRFSALSFREEENVHSVLVSAPNITMKVTDTDGNEITSARVGDQLLLRFEILDEQSK